MAVTVLSNQLAKLALSKLGTLSLPAGSVGTAVTALSKLASSVPLPLARRSVLGGFGTFGVGVAVGAGLALFLAPKAGGEMRAAVMSMLRKPWSGASQQARSAGVLIADETGVRHAAAGAN
jgi:hypothetical protein